MKKSGMVAIGPLFTVSVALLSTYLSGSDAGRTVKLPHYEVTFGTWPLMEVKKRGPLLGSAKSSLGPASYGPPVPLGPGPASYGPPAPLGPGPASYGPPVPLGPGPVPFGVGPVPPGPGPYSGRSIGGPPHSGFRLGPPPTPAKLLLLNPNANNKGTIHKHLQETLKHYAANKKPLNLQLPIIVKAPGPHPPPPPPGYRLGPPNGPLPDPSFRPGAPYTVNDVTSPHNGPRPSRLLSMLKNAAYSGMFRNTVDFYTAPSFSPGPPLSGTFISVEPDGTQILTNVNNNVIPGADSSQPLEPKPSIPPVLTIGDTLPENYTVLFAQRQIVGVKSPDTLEISGNASPGTSEFGADINLGTKYEQGYGAPPPPTHPLVITKFHKRGDIHHIPEKLIHQDLSDTGLMSTSTIVFATPNISAPLGGRNSEPFKQALEEKRHILKTRRKQKPLDAQVKLLGRLFVKLQRLKPPLIRVPANENEEVEDYHNKEPGGWNSPDDDGWKKVAKTKVDTPIMAVQIQSYSAPEVNSSDPDIIEAMAEFGNHDVEFGETDEIVNLMETLMHHGSSRVNLRDLGSNPDEINDNLLSWVRKHLTLTRNANHVAHQEGEAIASNQFKQFQTFITPPFGSNGWGPAEPIPVDPKRGSKSMPITLSHMTASMRNRDAKR